MRLILEGVTDDVQAAIILIALRMKRETDEENTGVLKALLDGVSKVSLSVERLCVLADPFNGCVRGLPAGPFVPAVLAACGIPSLTHGALSVGPKFGLSHRHVLEAAGVACESSTTTVKETLEDPNVNWAYLDQSVGVPELAALTTLRRRIVKRPCLTTLESGVTPFSASHYTHLVTGFVHKAYPPVYKLMANVAGFDGTTLAKGVEGSIVPTLTHESRVYQWSDSGGDSDAVVQPSAFGVHTDQRCVPLPSLTSETGTGEATASEATASEKRLTESQLAALAGHTAGLGIAALHGEPGVMLDSIKLSASVAVAGVCAGEQGLTIGQCLDRAARDVEHALTTGAAADRFMAAVNLSRA